MKKNSTIIVILLAVIALLLVVIALLLTHPLPWYSSEQQAPARTIGDMRLINPVVTTGLGKHFIINFSPLKADLQTIQAQYPIKTYVYFNYLNNASWIGLNEKDMFVAASTVKVPLAMAIYKAVENGKLKLSDSYTLNELDLDDRFGDLYKVGANKQFTVDQLVAIMLEQSDDTAMRAVLNIFNKLGIADPFSDVYSSMGWQQGDTPIITSFGEAPSYVDINLKTLANMFIALYDAKYVNVEHSQAILQYLAHTPFNNKIVAGVPESITVAHKIGIAANEGTFSDCGIVYAPGRNYILCLGSNGGHEQVANKFMSDISRAAYNYVINN